MSATFGFNAGRYIGTVGRGGSFLPMGDRKRKLEEIERRLVEVEIRQLVHGGRLDTVELRLEELQAYRFLRVEHNPSLQPGSCVGSGQGSS